MTEKDMRLAGETMINWSWTNRELKRCISAVKYTIAFLEGDDKMHHMTIIYLRDKLSELVGFREARSR